MSASLSGILIAGSSHLGKTTFADRLAKELGWNLFSTDALARHPGRPWPEVRPQVVEYYSRLSPEAIYWFLKVHHENMWPMLSQMIDAEHMARRCFIFEGSALRPEYIAPAAPQEIATVLFHTDSDWLGDRMRAAAQYSQADAAKRVIVDKFIDRSLRDNDEMHAAAKVHGMRIINVVEPHAIADLFDELVRRALPQ